ncbi:MAG TPA: GAF domain-containing protein [Candidatus Binatia bacterium]|jgi:GAF domain-containing protein|nr:GAF domain-containing protein [Candidatus Binatia bacterium]
MRLDGERAELLYAVTRNLATFHDVDGLVQFATRRLREIFEADGCAILLLDAGRREFRFPVASQREGTASATAELIEVRFPAERGIAGAVLANGDALLVADAQADSRFYADVDHTTGLTTRTVLAAPLPSAAGAIGVIEVVNPAMADLGPQDLAFLNALASDIAVAYEKANLYARLDHEVGAIRRLGRQAGLSLVVIGMALVGAVALAVAARALPWWTIFERPSLFAGLFVAGTGALLVRRARSIGEPIIR